MPSVKNQRVEDFIATLDHPYKAEIAELRQIILGADPRIGEEIKWNAPSFYTTQHFATFQLRAKTGVQIILHLGTKVRETATTGITIPDPELLLTWLAKDRASVIFQNIDEIHAKRAAFTALIREWIEYV
ncbi:MAG: DUF1801 domain-containing protein [Caldilineaceae bacterium]